MQISERLAHNVVFLLDLGGCGALTQCYAVTGKCTNIVTQCKGLAKLVRYQLNMDCVITVRQFINFLT